MNIVWTNWRSAAVAGAICLVLILLLAILSASPSDDAFQRRPSTFFTDQSGARGAYLVLQRVSPSVQQWRKPFMELRRGSGPALSTLIVMGPQQPLGRAEAAALDEWIASGGQLILASSGGWPLTKRTGEPFAGEFLESHELFRHGGLKGAAAIAHTQTAAVGKGRIIYVPDNYAFSNDTLRTTDNAVWLAQRSAEWAEGIGFDEYHQGFGLQRGLLPLIALFAATPWGLACAQLALAGAIYMFGFKKRFGKPLEELPVERTNPIETVDAISGLFEASRARSLSSRMIHQYLNAYVSSAVGYRADLLQAQTRERVANPAGTGREELDAYAAEVSGAIEKQGASDAALLHIAQRATAIARSVSHGIGNKRSTAAG